MPNPNFVGSQAILSALNATLTMSPSKTPADISAAGITYIAHAGTLLSGVVVIVYAPASPVWSATVQFQYNNGNTFIAVPTAIPMMSDGVYGTTAQQAAVTQTTTSGRWLVPLGGQIATQVRALVSAYTSGLIGVIIYTTFYMLLANGTYYEVVLP